MLDAMRRGAQSWVAKLLFAVLVVSFGVFWNVSPSFRSFGRGSIAHVGSKAISMPEFQRAFQNELYQLSSESGQRISTEQAVAYGLDRQVLDRLIAQAAVKEHTNELGLALSDAAITEGVRHDPAFAGPDGKFSKTGFEGLLRQMGVSELGFLAIRRDDELRRQLTEAMTGAVAVPKPMIELLHAWRGEMRTLEQVTVDANKAVTVPEPDEAKLLATYDSNKGQFVTPEYRKLAVLFLTVDDLKKEVTLSDDDVKASYEQTKDTYDKLERRRIQQIAFKDKASAEAARKELVEGKKNFLDVAKEQGATENDVNLGMLSKKQMIDKKVADIAFALARDKISDVIDGGFAPVVVRVIEIEEGKESTFDEVKDKVRDKLATEKAHAMIQERYDLVEEARNAGKTLKEIADSQKLKFVEIDATDKSNKTPDGKTALDYSEPKVILNAAFEAKPGAEHEAVELPHESYAWFDVLSVTEQKQKPFEEVKGEVKTFYEDTERKRLLNELAARLVERLNKGDEFAKIAAEAGGKAETTESLRRDGSAPGLTQEAIRQAFALPKGGAGYADTSDGKSRVLFRVTDIIPAAAPEKEQSDKVARELKNDLENDLLLAYVTSLRDRLGVTVNHAELKRATGTETEE
jgi:peptidyl-prolyl cis-trans isomerase D